MNWVVLLQFCSFVCTVLNESHDGRCRSSAVEANYCYRRRGVEWSVCWAYGWAVQKRMNRSIMPFLAKTRVCPLNHVLNGWPWLNGRDATWRIRRNDACRSAAMRAVATIAVTACYYFVIILPDHLVGEMSVHAWFYSLSQKQDTNYLPITSPNINRSSKFFHF